VLLLKAGLYEVAKPAFLPFFAPAIAFADDGGDPPPVPQFVPHTPPNGGFATHYGVAYNGRPLGCGVGIYDSNEPSIIAVGPANYRSWGCGASLRVCGAAGCIVGVRVDSCPGCGRNAVDLSEAGIDLVCGPGASSCRVTIEPGHWFYP